MYGALVLLLFMGLSAHAELFQGAITPGSYNEAAGTIQLRTANDDITINTRKLQPLDLMRMTSPYASEHIGKFEVPAGAITKREHVPLGLRSDCTELPLPLEDFEKIIDSPNVNNIEDFLRAIPEGSMEGYTYVINTLSAQRGGEGEHIVRPEWPRVIRTNATGTITFSWTCDPESPSYNQVEMLYTENGELKARSYELEKSAGTRGPAGRIDENPSSCVTCHSTGVPINGKLSMKHNWPEYFTWADCKLDRGISMYGMSDDTMAPGDMRRRDASSSEHWPEGCTGEMDEKANAEQQRLFQEFRKKQKDNPCYNLLPQPEGTKPVRDGLDYSYYPYHAQKQDGESGLSDYSLETNTRFTDLYAHLNSIRIAEILKKSPDYEKMKYYLIMEEGECLNETDRAMIKKMMPSLDVSPSDQDSDQHDPRKAPLLYSFARHAGMQPADWSLEYKTNTNYSDPTYNSVMPSESRRSHDWHMADVVSGNLLKDVASTQASLKPIADNVLTKGVEEQFGERHACIDKLGAGIHMNRRGRNSALCRELHRLNNENLERCRDQICQSAIETNTVPMELEETTSVLNALASEALAGGAKFMESVERGRELVQSPTGKGHCINCHSRTDRNIEKYPSKMLFMPGDTLPPSEKNLSLDTLKQRVNEGFMSSVNDHLSSGSMPYDTGYENPLSAQDVTDIQNYMKNLVVE